MLSFNVVRVDGAIVSAQEVEYAPEHENRNDWKTFAEAEAVAKAAGAGYIAIDAGQYVSPRYDVIKMFKVGEDVSYGFNGDAYPAGKVAKISPSKSIITLENGDRYHRRQMSGSWKRAKTWTLMHGTHHR